MENVSINCHSPPQIYCAGLRASRIRLSAFGLASLIRHDMAYRMLKRFVCSNEECKSLWSDEETITR